MKEFNSDIEGDGQFKLDLQSGSEVITSSNNEQQDDVTHLDSDDLIELEVEDPVAYQALMDQIEKQEELEDIEQRAVESEAIEITKKKEDDLRISIAKAYEDNNIDEKKQDEQFKKSIEDLYKKDPNEPYWQR